ncbi:MAG: hypothetical protein A2Y04_01990 [Omnitrophica WOR_2 bacterium GWC2_45_7]|nr:MAG: hypothetical protein A2Z81_08485 [Omnitrophica WOR_2 bacterium GWA2_45_18]OGX19362.1 MAG: hypothetical protein A2Y04_01990 [Omnitrophica WOR_2 bacterium GWC2_45_7]
MRRCKYVFYILISMVLLCTNQARAFVVINEILADPAAGLNGDANRDGVGSSSQDEFIELLNYGSNTVDLFQWTLSDATKIRHVFPSDTLLSPYQYLVVFSGGTPSLVSVQWQSASTGSLGLNNTADTITLKNGEATVIDQVVYGSLAGHDESIARYPEGSGTEFVRHSDLFGSEGNLFSPGKSVHGGPIDPGDNVTTSNLQATASVPEWPSLIYFGLGWCSLWAYTRKVKHPR